MLKERIIEAIQHQTTLDVLNSVSHGFGIKKNMSRWENATAALTKLPVAELYHLFMRTPEFGHFHLYVFYGLLNGAEYRTTFRDLSQADLSSLDTNENTVSNLEVNPSEQKLMGIVSFSRRLVRINTHTPDIIQQTFHIPFQIEASPEGILKVRVGIFNPRDYIGNQEEERFQFLGKAQFDDEAFCKQIASCVAASKAGLSFKSVNLSRAVRKLVDQNLVTAKKIDFHNETGTYGYQVSKQAVDSQHFCQCAWLKLRIEKAAWLGRMTWFFLKRANRVPSKNDGMDNVTVDPDMGMISFTRASTHGWEQRIDSILAANLP